MKIGIIDADLIGRKKHRFPNLACMKIAGYYKEKGDEVKLLLDYDNIKEYDKVYISKVFTDTYIDSKILDMNNVIYGGTGFFYDKAQPLDDQIEHTMPYYDLYKDFVENEINNGSKRNEFAYYLDYSIGFTTRGCFRQCVFCVNKNYKKVSRHSRVEEFLDPSRKYICLLDDNILGSKEWKDIFKELNDTGKRFQFKQGMDERILTEKKCNVILNSNYIGDYIFAFDDIDDKELIESKLKLWNKCKGENKRTTKFYVFCGFDRNDKYDEEFWKQDIIDTFERVRILMSYGCLPYIMRHENYKNSPYRGTYITLARWSNQPSFFKKKSYREFCEASQSTTKNGLCASMRYLQEIEDKYPEIAEEYFDIKFEKISKKRLTNS